MEYAIVNQQTTVRQVLNDVYEDINWAYLAQDYFGKSRSWLYHKFSGRNNGKPDDFSDIDRERLKGALVDIANRLRMTPSTDLTNIICPKFIYPLIQEDF